MPIHRFLKRCSPTKYSHLSVNQLYADPMFFLPWEMPRVAIQSFDMPPKPKGQTLSGPISISGLLMPSTFDTSHIVTALKYVWARELLWNNNVTYSLFALSDEQWESRGMGCVKQGGCWYFCKKHMQNFDIVDWKCKVEREAPRFILSQGC